MSWSESLDANLLKALAHPLRTRMLELIVEREEASPVELARELDQPLATVSHHARVLRDLGCIQLVRTEPRRGAVEHFYRAITLPFLDDEQWSRLPVALRRGLTGQTFRRIFAEGSEAGATGGFDRPGSAITRTLLALDERGWHELSEALLRMLEEAQLIQDRSDARAKDDGRADSEIRSSELAILHFALSAAATPTTKAPGRQARPSRSE
jgi:DNA-binding transcriptional ArsR family regulator